MSVRATIQEETQSIQEYIKNEMSCSQNASASSRQMVMQNRKRNYRGPPTGWKSIQEHLYCIWTTSPNMLMGDTTKAAENSTVKFSVPAAGKPITHRGG